MKNTSSVSKYYLNNSRDNNTKPLIKCVYSNCVTTTASVGYYLNSANNNLIYCKTNTICNAVNGISGTAYINQSERKNSLPVISCSYGSCSEINISADSIYVDGSTSLGGNYFSNIIKKIGNSVISFKFSNNKYSVENGYSLNSAVLSTSLYDNIIIHCVNKNNNGACQYERSII